MQNAAFQKESALFRVLDKRDSKRQEVCKWANVNVLGFTEACVSRLFRRLSGSGTENLGKDFPSLPAKPAASIQASLSDNSPGRRNGRSSPRATNSGSVKA